MSRKIKTENSKDKQLNIRISDVDISLLEKLCARTGKSKSDVIRKALNIYDNITTPRCGYDDF